jgi:hypothetical protein
MWEHFVLALLVIAKIVQCGLNVAAMVHYCHQSQDDDNSENDD